VGCALVWSDELARYRFRPGHPLDPRRLELTMDLIRAMELVSDDRPVVEPGPATDEDLLTVHDPDYVDAVKAVSDDPSRAIDRRFGLGTEDVPIVPRMHEMSRAVVGSTLTAARLVASGSATRSFSIAGGLHHAHAGSASGFCVYNDLAVAIDWLRREHGMRVLYIDIDAHHGDGVQSIFYRDPDVLTISLHESGLYLFPASGFVDELGEGDGHGFSDAVVPDLADAFRPDVIVLQAGCDAHAFDPLTHLRCSTNLYERLTRRTLELAEGLCGGRIVATGGGGYAIQDVVPRAWTLTWAALCGVEAPDPIPAEWLALIRGDPMSRAPDTLRDPPDLIPTSPRREEIDRANDLTVRALKRRLMPLVTGWGLGF
jgi:acetoin utilization protein AcuC